MTAVHELLVANVVALWLVTAGCAMVMLRRRRALAPELAEQSRQNRTKCSDSDLALTDWQRGD